MRNCNVRYQPLIVIGAARSGTKLVRDLIAQHPAIDRVPYDINFVWRMGNEEIPHDELTPEMLSPQIRRRIVKHVDGYHADGACLIEKTVSNCLRVAYVNAVLPDAKFIHLIRDGWDVVESAYREWTAPPDWRYILSKARSFPFKDAPGYAISYVWRAVRKLLSADRGKVSAWGPRYQGIDEDVRRNGVLETCAIQWTQCVEKTARDLDRLPEERVFTLCYEDFVREPRGHLEAIAEFADVPSAPYAHLDVSDVTQNNIGKGHRNLTQEQMDRIRPHLEPTLSLLVTV